MRRRQSLRRVAGELHLVADLRQEPPDCRRSVAVVVDDENPMSAAGRDLRACAGSGHPPPVGRRRGRQPQRELAPLPHPGAVGADLAAVKSGQHPHQGEPQTEPPLGAVGAARVLHEHLEQRAAAGPGRCRPRCREPAGRPPRPLAPPSHRCVRRARCRARVGQQIADHLSEPHLVRVDGEALGRPPTQFNRCRRCSSSGAAASTALPTTVASSIGFLVSVTLPRARRETSSRSSTRRTRCWACRTMTSRSYGVATSRAAA